MASSSNHSHSQKQKHNKEDSHESVVIAPATSTTSAVAAQPNVINRHTLQKLTKIVDQNVQIDEETEDMLLAYSDDFLEQIIDGACKLAKHRKANTLEVQDIEAYLERNHNWWISNSETRDDAPKPKKVGSSEAHRQRVALIKKTLKKY